MTNPFYDTSLGNNAIEIDDVGLLDETGEFVFHRPPARIVSAGTGLGASSRTRLNIVYI
jgi:hypothetical protein